MLLMSTSLIIYVDMVKDLSLGPGQLHMVVRHHDRCNRVLMSLFLKMCSNVFLCFIHNKVWRAISTIQPCATERIQFIWYWNWTVGGWRNAYLHI